jgi:alpha/beta superfamily hydrolase
MVPVEFLSSGYKIRGYFFPSPGDPAKTSIIFLQGFPGIEGDELICEQLAQQDINVLTFNYRGTFQSEGYFSFSNAVADIGAALNFLKDTIGLSLSTYPIAPDQIILGGWSFGSGMVPAGAVQFPEIKKFFCISGRDLSKEAQKIEADPDYAKVVQKNLEGIRAPAGPVKFKDDLLSDLINNQAIFDIEPLLPNLIDRDILLMAGLEDQVSPLEDHLQPLFESLSQQGIKVKLKTFQDDHYFSNSKDQLVKVILEWLNEK